MSDGHTIREEAGSISVTPSALSQLVIHAAEQVDGARVRRPRRGLDVSVADGRAHVELELAARFGLVLPDVAREAQRAVADALSEMCGLDVTAVDVAVEELDR